MALVIDRDLEKKIRRRLAELEESLEDRTAFVAFHLICQANRDIAEAIEQWTNVKLSELAEGEPDIQSLSQTLARIHQSLSRAKRIGAHADVRSMVLKVEGCSAFCSCRLRPTQEGYLGCLPDMVVAAILQRAMDTPVRIQVVRSSRGCIKRFTPAWLVDLLADLDPFGAGGLVVLYKDRVLFSHLPSEAEAQALSESLLMHEEHPEAGAWKVAESVAPGKRIMLTRMGDVVVSVCLQPNASETQVGEHVLKAIQRAVEAL